MEVNAHSLFSKWFSESGKLVSRLFAKIMELVSPSCRAEHPPAIFLHREQGETYFPLLGCRSLHQICVQCRGGVEMYRWKRKTA